MENLHQGLLSALNFKDLNSSYIEPINLINETEVYWFFQEMEKLFTAETSLKKFLHLIRHGQEAVWRTDDPMPFFALNFFQIPWLLFNSVVNRTIWNKVNFCLGQVL